MRSIAAGLAFSLWAFWRSRRTIRPVRCAIVIRFPRAHNDVPGASSPRSSRRRSGSSSSSRNAPAPGHDRIGLRREGEADGYTLLLTASPFVIAPQVYKTMPYDTLADFAPVVRIAIGRTCWSCIPRSA